MSSKTLGIIVVVGAVLIFGVNRYVVDAIGPRHPEVTISGLTKLGVDEPTCECKLLKELVDDISNADFLRNEYLKEIPILRKSQGKDDGFNKFVENLNKAVKAPQCYKGPTNVQFIPWGQSVPGYSLKRYSDELLCRPSDQMAENLKKALDGACCPADKASTGAHEGFHQQKCVSMGFSQYVYRNSADKAQEEAEAYKKQIEVECAQIKRRCPRPQASGDVLGKFKKLCG